jgi:hypothetical protein
MMRVWILCWSIGCASAQPTWAEGSAAQPSTPAAPLPEVARALTSDPAPMPAEGGGDHAHHHHHAAPDARGDHTPDGADGAAEDASQDASGTTEDAASDAGGHDAH